MSHNPKIRPIRVVSPSGGGDKPQDKRGLLERLGDKILQRLAKTAVADGEAYFAPDPRGLSGGTQGAAVVRNPALLVHTAKRSVDKLPRNSETSTNRVQLPNTSRANSKLQSQPRTPYVSRVNRKVPPAVVPGLPISVAPREPDPIKRDPIIAKTPGRTINSTPSVSALATTLTTTNQEPQGQSAMRVTAQGIIEQRQSFPKQDSSRRVESRPVSAQNRRLKICFLEDSCTSSHAVREALGERGYEVDHFSAAEEAFDALTEKNYDAVLASQIVSLGGMDCESLIRKLRHSSTAEKRALPVIAITANADPTNVQRFFAAGANDVVLKPVEGLELDERIQSTVRARRTSISEQPKLPQGPTPTRPSSLGRDVGPKGSRSRRLKVCFLEDSCTSSHAIRETLGDAGHEVDHFSLPEEALDAFFEKDYQVLLVSQIPVVATGVDTASLIRRVRGAPDVRRRNTPIVVLTTDGSLENRRALVSIGANDLVVKPVQGNLGEYLIHVADAAIRSLAVPERQKPAAVPRPDVAARRVPNRLRVCFLEDSCTSSHAIREMLGEAGHEVDHFSGPEEALDALIEKPYDVLLASQIVALGGLDCLSLIEAVRNGHQQEKRSLGIIAITANPEPANLQSFRNAGADAVIVKPIEGSLSERIKNILRTRPAGGSRPRPRTASRASTVHVRVPPPQPVVRPNTQPTQQLPAVNRQQDLGQAIGELNRRGGGQTASPPVATMTNKPRSEITAKRHPPPARTAPQMKQNPQPHHGPAGQVSPVGAGGRVAAPALRLPSAPAPRYRARARRKSSASNFVYVVILAAVVVMVVTSWHHLVGDVSAVSVSRVELGELYQSIPASGRVVSKRKVEVTAPASGQITEVRVREGEIVRKNQVLATMDRRDTDITLQRANAQLESAKKDVALAQRTLDRLVRALQMGAVSRQMAEDAEAALHASQARQRVASEEVKAARLASNRTEIMAPFNGTVLSAFAVEGAWTEPSTPLFTIVNMNEREIEIRTEATNSASIVTGQKVSLHSDAFPDQQWVEEVVRIAPGTSRDITSGISNSVSVYVSLSRKAPDLIFGQQVDAEIRLASTPKALKVPFSAITNQDGKTVVAIIDSGRVHFVPVVTGIESATHVQIKSGLKRGQRVILNSRNLKQGQKVEVVELPG